MTEEKVKRIVRTVRKYIEDKIGCMKINGYLKYKNTLLIAETRSVNEEKEFITTVTNLFKQANLECDVTSNNAVCIQTKDIIAIYGLLRLQREI